MKLDRELDPLLKKVAREGGTEAPFTGKYENESAAGIYKCAICGNTLFQSDAKFKATVPGLMGWPSFDQAIPDSVDFRPDNNGAVQRTEVVCKKCGAHLGHIFETGAETKTGKHFCINSVCLELKKKKDA